MRPRKTKIGKEVAHITRDSNTTFKVKGQGHQAALVHCTGRKHGHTVMVTYPYPYMTYIMSPLAGLGHIMAAARLQPVVSDSTYCNTHHSGLPCSEMVQHKPLTPGQIKTGELNSATKDKMK